MNTAKKKEQTILIVEDEDLIFSMIAKHLIDVMNEYKLVFALRRATSLMDAKKQWLEHSPVAVSLDMQFPLANGEKIDPFAGAKLYEEFLSPKSVAYKSFTYRKIAICSSAKVEDTKGFLKKHGIPERFFPAIYSKGGPSMYTELAKTLLNAAAGLKLG